MIAATVIWAWYWCWLPLSSPILGELMAMEVNAQRLPSEFANTFFGISINQPTNQPIKQPINQSNHPSVHPSINIHQPSNQATVPDRLGGTSLSWITTPHHPCILSTSSSRYFDPEHPININQYLSSSPTRLDLPTYLSQNHPICDASDASDAEVTRFDTYCRGALTSTRWRISFQRSTLWLCQNSSK